MKLSEIAKQDFVDHNDPAQMKVLHDLDHYTASPNTRLKPESIKFLTDKYGKRTGSAVLYRAMVFDDLATAKKIFGVDVKEGAEFTYKRDKESSWTKSKNFAYKFAQHGDLDEQYTVVIKATIAEKDFLLDVDDLSKNDLKEIYLQDQAEVIVNGNNHKAVIDKVIENY